MNQRHHAAFTLIEILLAIALIGLTGGLVATNANAIFAGLGKERPLPEILRKAVREARYLAAQNKEPAYLGFDLEAGNFLVSDGRDNPLLVMPTGLNKREDGLEVIFYQFLPGHGLTPPKVWSVERRETARLCFFPDRSSTPFEVFLDDGETQGTHRFDPFSEAEFIKEDHF